MQYSISILICICQCLATTTISVTVRDQVTLPILVHEKEGLLAQFLTESSSTKQKSVSSGRCLPIRTVLE